MAQKTIVTLVDDTDGTESPDVGTVPFSYKNVDYEIDLTAENQALFDKRMEVFIDKGRRVGSGRGRGRAVASANGHGGSRRRDTSARDRSSAIRAWAIERGHQVSERGRIPSAIQTEYDATH